MEAKYVDPVIEEIDSCNNDDYSIHDSCISILWKEETLSPRNSWITYNYVFNKDLTLKIDDYNLSEFAVECGVTFDYIKRLMLLYLCDKPRHNFSRIMSTYGLDINLLAWYLYHDVEEFNHFGCISYHVDHKSKDADSCVICLSRENLVVIFNNDDDGRADVRFLLSISPRVMSGGRMQQTFGNDYGRHYVIWSGIHEGEGFDPDKIDEVLMSYGFGFIYFHGKHQYGHPHIHVIQGDYHDIRAREMMITNQRKVNAGEKIEWSDFFHPLSSYYTRCSFSGGRYLVVALVIMKFRLAISHKLVSEKNLDDWYYQAFPNTCRKLEKILERSEDI